MGSAALEGTTECISYVTDISERKRVEEALRVSEALYRALFELSPLSKFLYDHETLRFLAVNDTATRRYGYSREELLGMTLQDIRPEEDLPIFLASIGAMGPGTTTPGLQRHVQKDGSLIDVDVTVHRFLFGDRPCGLAVALDVTERHRMERQLRQSQKMEAIDSQQRRAG